MATQFGSNLTDLGRNIIDARRAENERSVAVMQLLDAIGRQRLGRDQLASNERVAGLETGARERIGRLPFTPEQREHELNLARERFRGSQVPDFGDQLKVEQFNQTIRERNAIAESAAARANAILDQKTAELQSKLGGVLGKVPWFADGYQEDFDNAVAGITAQLGDDAYLVRRRPNGRFEPVLQPEIQLQVPGSPAEPPPPRSATGQTQAVPTVQATQPKPEVPLPVVAPPPASPPAAAPPPKPGRQAVPGVPTVEDLLRGVIDDTPLPTKPLSQRLLPTGWDEPLADFLSNVQLPTATPVVPGAMRPQSPLDMIASAVESAAPRARVPASVPVPMEPVVPQSGRVAAPTVQSILDSYAQSPGVPDTSDMMRVAMSMPGLDRTPGHFGRFLRDLPRLLQLLPVLPGQPVPPQAVQQSHRVPGHLELFLRDLPRLLQLVPIVPGQPIPPQAPQYFRHIKELEGF